MCSLTWPARSAEPSSRVNARPLSHQASPHSSRSNSWRSCHALSTRTVWASSVMMRSESSDFNVPANVQATRLDVEIGPFQPGKLTAAQPPVGGKVVQRVQPLTLDRVEERPALLRRPDHHGGRPLAVLAPALDTRFGPQQRLRLADLDGDKASVLLECGVRDLAILRPADHTRPDGWLDSSRAMR